MKSILAIRPSWIVARMTFQEAIRRRIVLTGLVLGILFLILFTIGFRMIFIEITREATLEGGAAYRNVMRAEMSNFLLMAGLYAITFCPSPWARCSAPIHWQVRSIPDRSRRSSPSLSAARLLCLANGWGLRACLPCMH